MAAILTPDLTPRLTRGAIAALAGGVVFGLMMSMMDMIGMIGGLVGQMGNVPVSWVLHMVISAIIGVGFGLVVPLFGASTGRLVAGGLVYGLVWWILGPLLIMPMLMGMGPQLSAAGMSAAMPSLVGHLVFGAVTALAWDWLARRG
ncbi:MAG: hypothetical protein DYG90_11855 [Chloroflexi bacterium CFX6]|nr:hypothetical protein [Chloroflexi bacterium CFX6]